MPCQLNSSGLSGRPSAPVSILSRLLKRRQYIHKIIQQESQTAERPIMSPVSEKNVRLLFALMVPLKAVAVHQDVA
jgi:hypothetical protein